MDEYLWHMGDNIATRYDDGAISIHIDSDEMTHLVSSKINTFFRQHGAPWTVTKDSDHGWVVEGTSGAQYTVQRSLLLTQDKA